MKLFECEVSPKSGDSKNMSQYQLAIISHTLRNAYLEATVLVWLIDIFIKYNSAISVEIHCILAKSQASEK